MRSKYLLVALALLAAQPAFAHAMLKKASPLAGSTVAAPPQALTLSFSESVEPAFSQIAIQDAANADMAAGAVAKGATAEQLTLPLKPLHPGVYKVEWHATSTDTHHTQGHYSFTVKP